MKKSELRQIIKEELDKILNPNLWAIYLDNHEDWNILANILERKKYRFAPGYTFSKYNKLSDFNPFKSEKPELDLPNAFQKHEKGLEYALSKQGYEDAMSHRAFDNFILINLRNKPKQINMLNSKTFKSRENSTYKGYKFYKSITDLIPNL